MAFASSIEYASLESASNTPIIVNNSFFLQKLTLSINRQYFYLFTNKTNYAIFIIID